MKYNPNKHHRRSIRLLGYDYTSEGLYFVTICVKDHECLFGKIRNNKIVLNNIGLIVEKEWEKTTQIRENIDLYEYIIMPNHIHGIIHIKNKIVGVTRRVDLNDNNENGAIDPIAPTENSSNTLKSNSLGSMVGQFKSVATKKIRKMGYIHFKWQRSYYEHIIRNEQDLNRIRTYIYENPLKWDEDIYSS